MTERLVCWNCGSTLVDVPRPISRHENCPQCFEVLRCCRMCRHYNADKRPYCDHDRAEPPVEKANANFCDFFKPANRFEASNGSRANQAKSELDALFGEAGQLARESDSTGDPIGLDEPLNRLKNLFDD